MQRIESLGKQTIFGRRAVGFAAIMLLLVAVAASLTASPADAARRTTATLGNTDTFETRFQGEDSTWNGGTAAGSDKGITSIHSIGDFNDDGFEDYAVGRAQANDDNGEVWLIYGRSKFQAKSYTANNSLPAGIGTRITTTDSDSALGASVSGGFDINGDHIDDVVMGAPNGGPTSDGAAYVLYGRQNPPRSLSISYGGNLAPFGGLNLVPSIGGDSEAESDDFGAQVSMGAAPQYTINTAYEEYTGNNPRWKGRGSIAISDPGNDNTLDSCDSVGFLDCGEVWWFTHFPYAADGYGSWNYVQGTTYTTGLPAPDAAEDGIWYYGCRVDGAWNSDEFGTSLDIGPDATGDGAPDMIVGAPDAERGDGAAYVISGERCMHRRANATYAACRATESYQGCGVMWAEDIDTSYDNVNGFKLHSVHDGSNDNFGKSVAIFDSGTRSGTDADAQALEKQAGDMNQDGRAEVAVGDPDSDFSVTDAGTVWVFPGQNPTASSPTAWGGSAPAGRGYKAEGHRTGDKFGTFISSGGDIDNDGLPDLLSSAPNTDYAILTQPDGAFTVDLGSEYILYGQDLRAETGVAHSVPLARESVDWTRVDMAGGQYNDPLFQHVSSSDGDGGDGSSGAVGDFNGNGTDLEVLVTAPGEDGEGLTDSGAWYQMDKLGTARPTTETPVPEPAKPTEAAGGCAADPSKAAGSPECAVATAAAARRCKALLAKRVRSRAALKVRGIGRVLLSGPRSVKSTSRTQAGLFGVLPSTQRRANSLKGKVKRVVFSLRQVTKKKTKFKTLAKDRKAPFLLDLKKKLKPGKYELKAVAKPARGKAKTLKIKFSVIAGC